MGKGVGKPLKILKAKVKIKKAKSIDNGGLLCLCTFAFFLFH
jgi:hypothetical protein